MRVNSEPLNWDHLPFANERELQRFIVKNAGTLLGLDVVSSTLPGGRPLHEVDILGIDEAGRLYIVECKHDAIDAGAIKQLLEYQDKLLTNWTSIEERVAEQRGRALRLTRAPPVLVAIGYRCEERVSGGPAVERLVFKYVGEAFQPFVDTQSPGGVYLAAAGDDDAGWEPHPEVLKRRYAENNLSGLPVEVREKFWALDHLLREAEIRPKYSGKKANPFASYRLGLNVCITASLGSNSITWCVVGRKAGSKSTIDMGIEATVDEIVETLRRAGIGV